MTVVTALWPGLFGVAARSSLTFSAMATAVNGLGKNAFPARALKAPGPYTFGALFGSLDEAPPHCAQIRKAIESPPALE